MAAAQPFAPGETWEFTATGARAIYVARSLVRPASIFRWQRTPFPMAEAGLLSCPEFMLDDDDAIAWIEAGAMKRIECAPPSRTLGEP